MEYWHPIFVHFPIALLFFAAICKTIDWFKPKISMRDASFYALVGAAIGAAFAVLSGGWDEEKYELSEAIHRSLEQHETLGYILLWILGTMVVWQAIRRDLAGRQEQLVYLVLLWVAIAVTVFTASLGGDLVYKDNIVSFSK